MALRWLDVSFTNCLCPTYRVRGATLPSDTLQDLDESQSCRVHRIDSNEISLSDHSPLRRASALSYRESVSYRETIVEEDDTPNKELRKRATLGPDSVALLDTREKRRERFRLGETFKYARGETMDSIARVPSFRHRSTISSVNEEIIRPLARTIVSFDLANGKLGLDVGRFRDFLLIVEIKPKCLVEQFNIEHAEDHDVHYGIVEVGDQILSVNNEKKPKNMLAQLNRAAQNSGKVVLRLRKRKKRFTVEIRPPRKKNGPLMLGIQCEVTGDTVKIISMKKGLITDWCQDHPTSNVCAGDWIHEVNGYVGADIITAMEDWILEPRGPLRIAIDASMAVDA